MAKLLAMELARRSSLGVKSEVEFEQNEDCINARMCPLLILPCVELFRTRGAILNRAPTSNASASGLLVATAPGDLDDLRLLVHLDDLHLQCFYTCTRMEVLSAATAHQGR